MLRTALTLLGGLLRATYQQGQETASGGELCALCMDAMVAAWDNWDLDPPHIAARVADLSTRVVVVVALGYWQAGAAWRVAQDAAAPLFCVLALVQTSETLAAGATPERAIA